MGLSKPRRPSYPHKRLPSYEFFRSQWLRDPAPRVSMVLVPIAEKASNSIVNSDEMFLEQHMRALATRLTRQHPDISTDPGIFGGNPHINNVRLTVGNILGKIYNYGSTKAVADIYAPYVTEAQVKEAIAYAQDFLEEAIHAGESSEIDG